MLWRLREILRAYPIASFSAGLVFALSFLLSAWIKMLCEGQWQEAAAYTLTGPIWLFIFAGASSLLVGVFAFVPALLIIILAEIARLRSAVFYGCSGVIAAVGSFYFFVMSSRPSPRLSTEWTVESAISNAAVALMIVAAGLVGGLAYWALAGKGAGDWHGCRNS